MLTRRDVVLGGSLTLLWGRLPCTAHAHPHGDAAYQGCTLSEEMLSALLDPQPIHRVNQQGEKPIIRRSGNAEVDQMLPRLLAHIGKILQVDPGVGFFDDHKGRNASASKANRLNKADGTVLMGNGMLYYLLSHPVSPEAAVASVMAHEFGHILQYKHNLKGVILFGESTARRFELQADFFSGYYAGRRKLEQPGFPATVFMDTRFAAGSDQVDSPKHHGTPSERAAAVLEGFKVANEWKDDLDEAVDISTAYVQRL